jgi:hypothetical protein
MSVTMGTECDQLSTSRMGDYGAYVSTDHERHEVHEVTLPVNVDLESCPEK